MDKENSSQKNPDGTSFIPTSVIPYGEVSKVLGDEGKYKKDCIIDDVGNVLYGYFDKDGKLFFGTLTSPEGVVQAGRFEKGILVSGTINYPSGNMFYPDGKKAIIHNC